MENSWIKTRLGNAGAASAGMAEAPDTLDGNITALVSLVCHVSLYSGLHSLISRISSIMRHGVTVLESSIPLMEPVFHGKLWRMKPSSFRGISFIDVRYS